MESLELRQHLSAGPIVPLADEPALPVVSISPVTVVEGNSGTTTAELAVSMSEPSDQTVNVGYFTVAETASDGGDYYFGSGTIVLTAGETSATFSITILGDRDYENDETFLVRFANAINATVNVSEVICTIQNDDDPSGDITPPASVTGLAAQAGDGQVSLAWTNPADADFAGVLIVRLANQAPVGIPNDGISYTAGQGAAGGTVVYAGAAAGFSHTGSNGTTYHYAVFAFDNARNYSAAARVAATPVTPPPVVTPDLAAPAAKLAKLATVKAGKTPYRFRIAYTDLAAVDAASMGHRNVLVTGPRRLKVWARLISKTPTGNAGRIVATYQFTAPGKIWGPEDNGAYTIWAWPGQVRDVNGNAVPKTKLGVLKVAFGRGKLLMKSLRNAVVGGP